MIEAVSGRLIGPKTWGPNYEKLLEPFWTVQGLFGQLVLNLFNKLCCGVHEARNGHGFRVHKVEPMLAEWAAHG